MDMFNFNLQLFADEDSVSLDTLKEQGFSEEDLQGLMPEPEPTPEPSPEPTPEPKADPTPEPEPIVPDHDNVSKHVPYDRFKEINDKNKVMAAELAALKAQQTTTTTPQQPAPVPQQQTQTSVEEQIAKIADEKVRKALEIDEDIDTLQYSDPAKYLKYVKSVAKEEFKLETQYEQQAKVYNENRTFVSELQQQADFPILYQFAINELDELPGKKARVIEQAFARIDKGQGSKEDIETMRTFVTECRTKMTGVTPESNVKPAATPTTIPLDKAIGLPRAQNLSGAKTGAMSMVEVEKMLNEGKFDQIPKDILKMIDPNLVK